MPIVVNTNAAATTAAFNLSKNHANLSKSLARLSSGQRITSPAEDAGGLAVAYKLDSSMKRTEAVLNNHQNALSYLQVQDGALESVGNIVSRMSELRTMAADVTKNSSDIANYSKEFQELQVQLKQVSREKFNGISLFAVNGSASGSTGLQALGKLQSASSESYKFNDEVGSEKISVYQKFSVQLLTHPSGIGADGSISLNVTNIEYMLGLDGRDLTLFGTSNQSPTKSIGNASVIENIADVSVYQFTHIIEKIADARAENGAEQQRVQSSYDLHSTNLVNLEAAHSRIMDIDVALESTRFAKHNVLVQASASMTAQANQLSQVALTLLQ
ncbi:MAG: flagellin [Opitutales bacterium]|nr:flagellin [Opitutales bacterium]